MTKKQFTPPPLPTVNALRSMDTLAQMAEIDLSELWIEHRKATPPDQLFFWIMMKLITLAQAAGATADLLESNLVTGLVEVNPERWQKTFDRIEYGDDG